MKLQQQQQEIFRMAGYNAQTAIAMTARMQQNHSSMVSQHRNYASVALCGCAVTNPIREFVIKMIINPWFDRIILLFILANSICLAIEDPANRRAVFGYLDILFVAVFTAEMVLKVIAMGFVMRPYSYLRDPWNVVSILSLFSSTVSSSSPAGSASLWSAPTSTPSELCASCGLSKQSTACPAWPAS
jgi:hypothetical protein